VCTVGLYVCLLSLFNECNIHADIVVLLGAGGRIMLMPEWSFVNGTFRNLKER
jgi:hypothetical protein